MTVTASQNEGLLALTSGLKWSALAAPAAAALIVRLAAAPLTVDDAYIILRYARNLAEGVGFVYNPGQPVLGTTTPLYTLLLAALASMGATDLPRVAATLNALLDAGSAALLAAIVLRITGSELAGLGAGLLFAFAPMSVAYSSGGMEGSLFNFLLMSAMALALARPTTLVAAILGLATLTRPEAALAVILLLAHKWWTSKRLPLAEGLIYAGMLLPWVIFATWYFGSPLPNTLGAKASAYQVEPPANALGLVLQFGLPAQSLFLLTNAGSGAVWLAMAAVVAAALLAMAAARFGRLAMRRRPASLPWLIFAPSYALAYAAAGLGGVRMFHWYLVPLVPFYALLLAGGAWSHTSAKSVWRNWLPALALVIWWLPGLELDGQGQISPRGFSVARESLYRDVSAAYAGQWSADTVIAAPEVGALGYYSGARILDSVGLVSPEARRFQPLPLELLASDNAVPAELIRSHQPDYVVSLDQFVRRSLVSDPWFQQHYRLVEARPAAIWNSESLMIFERAPTPQ